MPRRVSSGAQVGLVDFVAGAVFEASLETLRTADILRSDQDIADLLERQASTNCTPSPPPELADGRGKSTWPERARTVRCKSPRKRASSNGQFNTSHIVDADAGALLQSTERRGYEIQGVKKWGTGNACLWLVGYAWGPRAWRARACVLLFMLCVGWAILLSSAASHPSISISFNSIRRSRSLQTISIVGRFRGSASHIRLSSLTISSPKRCWMRSVGGRMPFLPTSS